jgi:AcrR family transcriptional regulator
MATAPDRRTRRTKRLLQNALIDLMSEKDYGAITVRDLIDRADVGRSTFYGHYTHKDELLRDNFTLLRSIIEQPAPSEPTRRRLVRFSLPLFRHVAEQQRLARALLGSGRDGPMLRQVEELLADVVRAELTTLFGGHPWARAPQEAVVRYVVGAYLSLLNWWLATNLATSPEDVDRIFQTLVSPGIRAVTRDT